MRGGHPQTSSLSDLLASSPLHVRSDESERAVSLRCDTFAFRSRRHRGPDQRPALTDARDPCVSLAQRYIDWVVVMSMVDATGEC